MERVEVVERRAEERHILWPILSGLPTVRCCPVEVTPEEGTSSGRRRTEMPNVLYENADVDLTAARTARSARFGAGRRCPAPASLIHCPQARGRPMADRTRACSARPRCPGGRTPEPLRLSRGLPAPCGPRGQPPNGGLRSSGIGGEGLSTRRVPGRAQAGRAGDVPPACPATRGRRGRGGSDVACGHCP